MEQQFTISELDAAQACGLSLVELKKARTLERAQKNATGRWLWCPTGVAEVQRQMAQGAAAIAEPEMMASPAASVYTVVRVRTPQVLHVVANGETYDPAQPRCVWLPQPRGVLFTPGMRVLAQPRPGRKWLLDFAGNPDAPERGRRFPRGRGKW